MVGCVRWSRGRATAWWPCSHGRRMPSPRPWMFSGPWRARCPACWCAWRCTPVKRSCATDDNYVGHAVIRCARLRACAHGGQVLLSDVAAGLVADHLPTDATVRDLGVHRLRDLGRPERVWQLVHPDLTDGFAPLRTLDEFRHNLPSPPTPLVGRVAEMVELRRLAVDQRLVTVTGAGGVGKTRLAQQVAAELVDRFPDGVWWVDLASVVDADRVGDVVAAAAGLVEVPGRRLVDDLMTVAALIGDAVRDRQLRTRRGGRLGGGATAARRLPRRARDRHQPRTARRERRDDVAGPVTGCPAARAASDIGAPGCL